MGQPLGLSLLALFSVRSLVALPGTQRMWPVCQDPGINRVLSEEGKTSYSSLAVADVFVSQMQCQFGSANGRGVKGINENFVEQMNLTPEL